MYFLPHCLIVERETLSRVKCTWFWKVGHCKMGVCALCFPLGVTFCEVDDNCIQDLNWIFYYLPIYKKWNHCREMERWGWWWGEEFNYFSCHNWQRIIQGPQQSTVMQRRQQHHFDALVFPLGMHFVCALVKLPFFNSSSPACKFIFLIIMIHWN